MVATWALRPEGIQWPEVQTKDGSMRPSFRLELLTKANHLSHEHAHDALSDVQATIDVARLIAAKQPKLWQFALRNRSKSALKALVNSRKPLLWVSPIHGYEHGYMRFVLPVGQDPNNPNSILMWDLSCDPKELLSLTTQELKARLFKRESELLPGQTRLPIYACKINQSPFLVGQLAVLTPERADRFQLDRAVAERHAVFLLDHVEELSGLWAEVLSKETQTEEIDVDSGLYCGAFTSERDRSQMEWIHQQTPQALSLLVESQRIHFDDPRFDEMLFRFRARNWPETLSEQERARWQQLRVNRLIHGVGVQRTLDEFSQEIEELVQRYGEEIDETTEEIFGALYDWVERMSNSLEE